MSPLSLGLLDDAAVFPPGSLPLPEAVAAHRRYRASEHSDAVGPLVLPARLVASAELEEAAVGGDAPLEVLVVGAADELAALRPAAGVLPVGVEVGGCGDGPAARSALASLEGLQLPMAVEVPRSDEREAVLDEVLAAGARAKVRTGGLEQAAFPSVEELAGVVRACVERQVPFKCTAGLHHLDPYVDPATGLSHHGFGGVLLAVHAALSGGDVEGALREPRTGSALRALDPLDQAAVRRVFASFGTCSVLEPLDDLRREGLA